MKWLKNWKEKWGIETWFQFFIIMLVFACTGTTVVLIKRPLIRWVAGDGDIPTLFYVVYYLFILPVYYSFLLLYGWAFGQFPFFWSFFLKTARRFQRVKKG